jgi:hypothetical protein
MDEIITQPDPTRKEIRFNETQVPRFAPVTHLAATTDYLASNLILPSFKYSENGELRIGLVIGSSYLWTKGENDGSIIINDKIPINTRSVFTATSELALLNGKPGHPVTAAVSLLLSSHLFPTKFTPSLPVRPMGVTEWPRNLLHARHHRVDDHGHYVKSRNGSAFFMSLSDFSNLGLAQDAGLTWSPPHVLQQLPAVAKCRVGDTAVLEFHVASEYDLTYKWELWVPDPVIEPDAPPPENNGEEKWEPPDLPKPAPRLPLPETGTWKEVGTDKELRITPTSPGIAKYRCSVTDDAGDYGHLANSADDHGTTVSEICVLTANA